MDRKEYKIRVDEIQRLIKRKKYSDAADLADSIDWRNVQNISMLCTISDLYKVNRRPEDARAVLSFAYDKHPQGRMIVYSMCELSLLCGDIVSAKQYYNEFVKIAPRDSGKYILEYKIYVAMDVRLEERIAVLEELKKRDYREKWGYELAYLYHRVGLSTECIQECDELFLWFENGKYVTKALELKMLHEPLSPEQQRKYKGNKRPSVNTIVQGAGEDINIEVQPMNVGEYGTINLQKEIAENLQPYLYESTEVVGEPGPAEDTDEVIINPQMTDQINGELGYDETAGEFTREILSNLMGQNMDSVQLVEVAPGMVAMDTGYVDEYGQPIFTEPMPVDQLQYATAPYPENGYIQENQMGVESMDSSYYGYMDSSEVTVEEYDIQATAPITPADAEEERIKEKAARLQPMSTPKVVKMSTTGKIPKIHQTDKLVPLGVIAPTATEMAKESLGDFEDVISQEDDGQMSLVMPRTAYVERQITGQMDIETIMNEWNSQWEDRKKTQSELQREKAKRTTDNLFAEFDEATKNDVLHELEKMAERSIAREKKRKISPSQAQERLAEKARKQAEEMKAAQEAEEAAKLKAKEEAELLAQMEAKEAAEAAIAEALKKEAEAEIADEVLNPDDTREEISEEIEETVGTEAEVENDSEEDVVEDFGDDEEASEEEPKDKEDSTETESKTESSKEDESKETEEEKAEDNDVEEAVDETSKEETEEVVEKAVKKEPRAMTSEEKRVFGSFIQTKATKDQIVNCIDSMSLASYTGNVLVTGERGMGSVKLAKTLLKEMHLTDANFSNKVAKMTGLSMNGKDMEELLGKLDNGALLVEKAGNMKEGAIRHLLKALDSEKRGIVVILEDTRININKLINNNEDLEKFFNIRVDIEALDNDALVSYAKKYAESREYVIDELGVLALYERIAESQTSDHAVTTRDVQEMVEDSIRHANKKTIPHFVDTLIGKRYDEEDMIIIREKDIAAY